MHNSHVLRMCLPDNISRFLMGLYVLICNLKTLEPLFFIWNSMTVLLIARWKFCSYQVFRVRFNQLKWNSWSTVILSTYRWTVKYLLYSMNLLLNLSFRKNFRKKIQICSVYIWIFLNFGMLYFGNNILQQYWICFINLLNRLIYNILYSMCKYS